MQQETHFQWDERLVDLVLKLSALRAADLGFNSCFFRRDFSGLSHTIDLKIGTPVATLPGAWRYRVDMDWLAQCQYTVTGMPLDFCENNWKSTCACRLTENEHKKR